MTDRSSPCSVTYRQHFAQPTDADGYEISEYGEGSYSRLLWQLEQGVLADLISKFRKSHDHIAYLDFASGTGRIAAFMEHQVDDSTSIEISESMAEIARRKILKTKVLCKDITHAESSVEGHYDMITAFRFFLNAEPSLRHAAMRAIAVRLKDNESVFIFNNHGNLWSVKLLGWPFYRLKNIGRGWIPKGNYMTHAQVMKLLDLAGLKLVSRQGIGFLGGTICNRLPFSLALRIEKLLSGGLLSRFFGQDIIYVVSPK